MSCPTACGDHGASAKTEGTLEELINTLETTSIDPLSDYAIQAILDHEQRDIDEMLDAKEAQLRA